MVIVVAFDSFKGSLTSMEAATAVEKGLKRTDPSLVCIKVPLADGGEGTAEALVDATGGSLVPVAVSGPLGEQIQAHLGILGDGKSIVVEVAQAVSLPAVPLDMRNPMIESSLGVGELLAAALEHHPERIILALGGSSTMDGGIGALSFLGARFFDSLKQPVPPTGKGLLLLDSLDFSQLDQRFQELEIILAADVTNPLSGDKGAAKVFGAQKGAKGADIEKFDRALDRFGDLLEKATGKKVKQLSGAGAAGGMGAGFAASLGGSLVPGFNLVAKESGLEEKIKKASLVITGEGEIDFQTLEGKVPYLVAKMAARYNIPAIAVVGCVSTRDQGLLSLFSEIYSLQSTGRSQEECMEEAATLLEEISSGIPSSHPL